MRRQKVVARAVRGGKREGADGEDAFAALSVAELAAASLSGERQAGARAAVGG